MADAASRRQTGHGRTPRREGGRGVATFFKWLGIVFGTLLLIGITTGVILFYYGANYLKNVIVPEASKFEVSDYDISQSTDLLYYDKNTENWEVLETIYLESDSSWVTLDQIPENLINATVAIEDKRFWTHHGVDWLRTASAIKSMFTGGSIYGGSTITQQMIKNMTQEDEVTVKRKVVEIFRALAFEKSHKKEEILELYLNVIYLGENCDGVGAASYAYFGKDVSELDLAQCASLIAITNNPSLYDPYLHEDKNKERQETILYQMWDQKMISQEEYDAAVAEKLVFIKNVDSGEEEEDESSLRSWYADEVINQVMSDLMDTYEYSATAAKMVLFCGGLDIYTSYDPEVQAVVDSVYENLDNLPYTSAKGKQMQSGITIVDNETGAVVALSGGMGEKSGNLVWNRATDTVRQPGSSIKPIAVYAPALDLGLITPNSVRDDAPYMLLEGSPWPSNSNRVYSGLTTISTAVAKSTNTIAVRVLAEVGVDYSFDYLERLGISSLESYREVNGKVVSDYGLAQLALGGLTDGASTYEMAGAYSTFPRNGEYIAPYVYTSVEDPDGNVLLSNSDEAVRVMKESTAYYINTMLKSVITSGTGTSAAFSGMTIAGKTGTTTSNYDRWFAGYSPYYTAVVWTGYDSAEKMSGTTNPAAILWKQVMSGIHEDLENKDFTSTVSTVSYSYCTESGMLPTEYCKLAGCVANGTYVQGDEPTQYCTLHVGVKVCTDSPILDEDGNPTGMYHLAGEYCPEESVIDAVVLDYERDEVSAGVSIGDSNQMKSWLEAQGTCDVHDENYVPEGDEPVDDPDAPYNGEGGQPGDEPGQGAEGPGTHPGNTGEPGTPPTEPGTPVTPVEPVKPEEPDDEPEDEPYRGDI